jgi:hypothetical protein
MKVVLRHCAVTVSRLSMSLYAWKECGGVSSLPLLRLSGDEGMYFALQMKTRVRTLVLSFLSKENSVAQELQELQQQQKSRHLHLQAGSRSRGHSWRGKG